MILTSQQKANLGKALGIFVLLLLVTLLFEQGSVDLWVASQCYNPDLSIWKYGQFQPWKWLFEYGTIPGLTLTLASLALWFFSFSIAKLQSWRRYFLLIFLTSIIGGGLIVNTLLKDYWGRPRPREVTQFKGLWDYRPIVQPGVAGRGKSFPCGHCTMGYLFLSLFFLRKKSKLIAYLGGGLGILYGGLMSTARILQGGHFVNDTLWSGGVILITAFVLATLLQPEKESSNLKILSKKQQFGFGAAILVLLVVIALFFMTRRPFYISYKTSLALPNQPTELLTNFEISQSQIRFSDHLPPNQMELALDAEGFGWTQANHQLFLAGTANQLSLQILTSGYFNELRHNLILTLPSSARGNNPLVIHPTPQLPPLQAVPPKSRAIPGQQ